MIQVRLNGGFMLVEAIGDLHEADLPPLHSCFDEACQVGPFVVLTDTSAMKSAPKPVLRAFGEGLKTLPALEERWLGNAVVLKSPMVRFLLSGLMLFARMPTKVETFGDLAKAKVWCAEIMKNGGLAPPTELLRSA